MRINKDSKKKFQEIEFKTFLKEKTSWEANISFLVFKDTVFLGDVFSTIPQEPEVLAKEYGLTEYSSGIITFTNCEFKNNLKNLTGTLHFEVNYECQLISHFLKSKMCQILKS